MANNIVVGFNGVVAKADMSFVDAGIDATNTSVIYEVAGSLKSYVPGRPINAVTGFLEGKGYYLVAKTVMDLEAVVVPPLSGVAPPDDELEDLIFTTTNGFVDGGGGIWSGSNATAWGNMGVANKKVAAGQNGFIQYRYTNVDQKEAFLAFDDNDSHVNYSLMQYGFYLSSSGVYSLISGTIGSFIEAIALNNYYRVNRLSTTVTLQRSTDGETFTTIATLASDSSADLFIKGNIDGSTGAGVQKIRQPKGFNLTTAF